MENDINNQGETAKNLDIAGLKLDSTNSFLLKEPDLSEKIDPPTERYKDTSQLRRHTGYWVMIVVSQWLFVVICLVILVGLNSLELNDSVIITLLGTTTVNIIGLPYVLLKGLYPQDKEISKLSDEISKLTKQKSE